MSSTQTPQADEREAILKALTNCEHFICHDYVELTRDDGLPGSALSQTVDRLAALTPPKQVPAEQVSEITRMIQDYGRARFFRDTAEAHRLFEALGAAINRLATIPQPPQGAEGEALERDAMRYRWLCGNKTVPWGAISGLHNLTEIGIDAAIDAALSTPGAAKT